MSGLQTTSQTESLQAKYDLIHELHDQYNNLAPEVHGAIDQETLTGERQCVEWLDMVEQMLEYKLEAKPVRHNKFLVRPSSSSDILTDAFGQAVLLTSILWAIVEHGDIYPLSWPFWAYALAVSGIGGVYTWIVKEKKGAELATANANLKHYEKHLPLLNRIRTAETRITPSYEAFLHPMLALLKEELPDDHQLSITFNMKHWKSPEYKLNMRDHMASRYVTSTEFYECPLFEASGRFADNTLVHLSIIQMVRTRHIRKVNPRGKVKYKTKNKYKLVYKVNLGVPAQAYEFTPKIGTNFDNNVKRKQNSSPKRHIFKLQQVKASISSLPKPQHKVFIDLIGSVYSQLKPK